MERRKKVKGFNFNAVVEEAKKVEAEKALTAPPPPGAVAILNADQACRILRRQFSPQVDLMKKEAEALVITNDETMSEAIARAGNAKKIVKALTLKRREVIKEPDTFVNTVNAFVKTFVDDLERIERNLKGKVATRMHTVKMEELERTRIANAEAARVQAELTERTRKLQAEAQAEADKINLQTGGNFVAETIVAPVVVAPVVPSQKVFRTATGSSMHMRKSWRARLENIKLVDAQFLLINEEMVQGVVDAGIRSLSGFVIEEFETPVIRA
jgi:hypothetical protein